MCDPAEYDENERCPWLRSASSYRQPDCELCVLLAMIIEQCNVCLCGTIAVAVHVNKEVVKTCLFE